MRVVPTTVNAVVFNSTFTLTQLPVEKTTSWEKIVNKGIGSECWVVVPLTLGPTFGRDINKPLCALVNFKHLSAQYRNWVCKAIFSPSKYYGIVISSLHVWALKSEFSMGLFLKK